MRLRTPLVVAVVGALLVGGATTGTTLALWRGQDSLAASAVDSGTIALNVNGTTSATFTAIGNLALNSGATPGAAQSFTATLTNASSGKNMRMQMHLDDVTTANVDLNTGLQIAVSGVATADSCPANPSNYQDLSVTNSHVLTGGSLSPNGTRKLCVSVRVEANAPASVASKTGGLTFSFRGEQVRP